jgi:hypothetical protein
MPLRAWLQGEGINRIFSEASESCVPVSWRGNMQPALGTILCTGFAGGAWRREMITARDH